MTIWIVFEIVDWEGEFFIDAFSSKELADKKVSEVIAARKAAYPGAKASVSDFYVEQYEVDSATKETV